MATLAVVELEAMNAAAPEAVQSKQNGDIPDAAYQPIWSFFLDCTSVTASSLDFKDIRSFMLANKTSKGAFEDCRGWWGCEQALKREVAAMEFRKDTRYVGKHLTLDAVRKEIRKDIWMHRGGIPVKRLMKIFQVRKESSQERQNKFRELVKELCNITVATSLLVLKQHYVNMG
jgi:ribosomal protein L29